MTALVIGLRPHVPQPTTSLPPPCAVKPRDLVTWRNPNTGEVWGELVVEFVYRTQGYARVRGCFGRMSARTGEFITESRSVRLEHLTAYGQAGEVQS